MTREQDIVIGTVLSDPGAIIEAEFLAPTDFTPQNAVIWRKIRELHAQRALTARTLEDALDRDGGLEAAGGHVRLAGLLPLADSKGLGYYVDVVTQEAMKVEMKELAKLMVRDAQMGTRTAIDMVEYYSKAIANLRRGSVGKVSAIGSGVDAFHSNLLDVRAGKVGKHWTPATRALLPILGHVEEDDFVMIPARPGKGKTSWLKYEAVSTVYDRRTGQLTGHEVLLFNYENSRMAMLRSILAHLSGVDSQKLKLPSTLSKNDFAKYERFLPVVRTLPIHVVDAGFSTIDDIKAVSRRMHAARPLRLIMVDYLQLIQSKGGETFETVSDAAQQLRSLAQDLMVPVLCTAQLNRAVDAYSDQKPRLGDIMYDGERATKVMMAPWLVPMKPEDYGRFPENDLPGKQGGLRGEEAKAVVMKMLVLKNSNGPVGETEDIKWNKSLDMYETLTPDWRKTVRGKQGGMF